MWPPVLVRLLTCDYPDRQWMASMAEPARLTAPFGWGSDEYEVGQLPRLGHGVCRVHLVCYEFWRSGLRWCFPEAVNRGVWLVTGRDGRRIHHRRIFRGSIWNSLGLFCRPQTDPAIYVYGRNGLSYWSVTAQPNLGDLAILLGLFSFRRLRPCRHCLHGLG